MPRVEMHAKQGCLLCQLQKSCRALLLHKPFTCMRYHGAMTSIADKPARRCIPTRGLCLFFGVFALLNVFSCVSGGDAVQNMNMWWIDLGALSLTIGDTAIHFGFLMEALAGILMIWWAAKPHAPMPRRVLTCVFTAGLCAFALHNAYAYWVALASGSLYWALPVPLSAVIAVIFGLITWRVARSHAKSGLSVPSVAGVLAVAVVTALVFPLLQIGFFGTTDYRRSADAAVVFGARVYSNTELSIAMQERMDTVIELYQQGCVKTIIVSGGIEDEGPDEAQAMYNYAVSKGVPSSALLIDRYGSTTKLTVENSIKLAKQYKLNTIIATSSFYHMPRIKMLYNLNNVDVLTVPTVGDVFGNGTLVSIWREIPAWWYYWFKESF